VRDQENLLQQIVSPNPRRIKRTLNTCSVTFAVTGQSAGLRDIHQDLITRLAVMRVQSAELFAEVTRNPELLVALELVYQGNLEPSSLSEFTKKFSASRAEAMQAAVKRFHGSQEYLRSLFRDSAFDAVAADLPRYLTMLGGAP